MKKTFAAIILGLAAVNAGAQTMYDALLFSQNEYYGTARSMALGNAMTALGGDLGSIGINPAGSAVYNFSQFTISPGVTISSQTASYSPYLVNGTDIFKGPQNQKLTRFAMPNIGTTLNFQTGNRTGVKAVTFGFTFNQTNNFTGKMLGGGLNDRTSFMSAMAVDAFGYDTDFLGGYGYLDRDGNFNEFSQRDMDYPYNNADDRGNYAPWNVITAAQAGALSTYGDPNDPDYYWRYIGASERFSDTGEIDEYGNHIYDISLAGPLNQAYGRRVTGSKNEALFNMGLNINDNFYIGANLGIVDMVYNYDEYFKEAAADPSDFLIEYDEASTYFSNFRSQYSYSAEGTGVYAKIGLIALPVPGLRIGAAIQTPTLMQVNETWRSAADIHFLDPSFDGSAKSPYGEYSYVLKTPFRANAGIAYSIMEMFLLSADYEITDYSTMKFKSDDIFWDSDFSGVNSDILDCMGVSHSVRAGIEFKPVPELATRFGYNFITTPEYSYDGLNKYTLNDKINSWSVGLGYSSNGSFFADLAARMSTYCDETIYPYADYLSDYTSPAFLVKRNRYSIIGTIGWRF